MSSFNSIEDTNVEGRGDVDMLEVKAYFHSRAG